MEIFKDIQGYEDFYQVSNLGRVKSLPRIRIIGNRSYLTKERFLRQRIHDGYYRVNLCLNGRMKTINVHLLVINGFVEKQQNKIFANHKDFDKLNNNSLNLEWTSIRENNTHRHLHEGKKTSKYPYVSKKSGRDTYTSRIVIDGKQVSLGNFKNEDNAYQAVLEYQTKNKIQNKYI